MRNTSLTPSRACYTCLLLIGLAALLLFTSCASIAPTERLFLGQSKSLLTVMDGTCNETSLLPVSGLKLDTQEALDPTTISLLGWNIYKGQREGWEKDLLEFSTQADIILLQEALLDDALKQVFDDQEMFWSLNNAFRYKGREAGVLIASKVQPLSQCGMRHPEPITVIPKTMLISRFSIQGTTEELLVANIHGINFSTGLGSYQEQFTSLREILQNHQGPLVLVGDFNNWSEGRTGIVEQLAEALSLEALAFSKGKRTLFWGQPLDHIFYRGLIPVTANIHAVKTSDHNPMIVTFKLPPLQIITR